MPLWFSGTEICQSRFLELICTPSSFRKDQDKYSCHWGAGEDFFLSVLLFSTLHKPIIVILKAVLQSYYDNNKICILLLSLLPPVGGNHMLKAYFSVPFFCLRLCSSKLILGKNRIKK